MVPKQIMKAKPRGSGAQEILDSIRRVVRELRVTARAAEADAGLSGAQLFVLSRIAEGRGLSLRDLAARTLTDPSSVSVVVGRLVSSGLATRRRSPEDERRVEISITPAGCALLRRAPPAAQERLLAAVEALPASKRATLARLLDEVVSAMGADGSTPPLFFEDDAKKRRPRRRAAPPR